jgi:hypothetical protein
MKLTTLVLRLRMSKAVPLCLPGAFIVWSGMVRGMTHCPSLLIKCHLLVMNLMHKLLKAVESDLVIGHVEENGARYMGTCWSTLCPQFLWV